MRDDIRACLMRDEKELFQRLVQEFNLTIEFQPTDLRVAMLNEAPYEVISL